MSSSSPLVATPKPSVGRLDVVRWFGSQTRKAAICAGMIVLLLLAGMVVSPSAGATVTTTTAHRHPVVSSAAPCWTGNTSRPLQITTPGRYNGCGQTVPGIEINASDVIVENFVSRGADSTGIWAAGRNVTIQDNTITQVRHTIYDLDAIRFFGDGTKILRNHIYDLVGNNPGGSHVDCVQTWATSRPGSSNVLIAGNRCEGIPAQGVMAEGPGSTGGGGGGGGDSRNWVIEDNYFDCYANQTISLRAIHTVAILRNTFAGAGNKAVQITDGTSGVTFDSNILGSRIGTLFGP